MASKESEKQMIKTLQDLLRQLYEIETIAGDFTRASSQDLLLSRLQELQQGLQQFKERAAAYKSTQVPAALCRQVDDGKSPVANASNIRHLRKNVCLAALLRACRHVDDGGHPDDFVRQMFKQAVADNQLAAGKVAAIQALRDELMAAATAAFPDDTAVYRSVVESKQQQQQQLVAAENVTS